MIRLSIIVPAFGEQTTIDATLLSVLENRPSNCEVIVPCCESYVDPYDLADEVRFVACPDDSPISFLVNAGLSSAVAGRAHWITPGVVATDGWTESPVRSLGDGRANFVAPLILSEADSSRIESAGVRYKTSGARKVVGKNVRHPSRKSIRLRADGPTLSAGFCRTESLIAIGGFRSTFGSHLTDADLASRIRAHGESCVVDTSSCLLNQTTPSFSARCNGYRDGRDSERLYWEHARSGGAVSLLGHSAQVAVDLLRQCPRPSAFTCAIGRIAGMLQSFRSVDDIGAGISYEVDHEHEIEIRRAA